VTKYFVRSASDAPEKGPYSPKELARSLEKGLVGAKATARREDSDEWVPARDVVGAYLAERAEKRSARSSAATEHAMAAVPSARAPNIVVWTGVLMGVAGIALTAFFASSGRSSEIWPVALIVGGAYMAVRGLIRGALRKDDQ
jgi:hypothetical protein